MNYRPSIKRQPHVSRKRKALQIIPEEDERAPSPPWIADGALLDPRPAPRPPSSTSSSPASSGSLPLTPTSSDDEFILPVIKPLTVNKKRKQNYDSDSDSEWYSREFSKILTLSSSPPLPSSARPDSVLPRSRPLPFTPLPSMQLDPAYPRPAKHRPPHLSLHRPPPNSPLPTDCSSDDDLDSPSSEYSQPDEFEHVDVVFDFDEDAPMRLPLSLPSSPIDLEADIATGLEQLRLSEQQQTLQSPASSVYSFPSATDNDDTESKVLRSRWSSSTLSSLREDQARSGTSKLRSYFSKRSRTSKSGKAAAMSSPVSPSKRFRTQQRQSRRESQILTIGYGSGISWPTSPTTPATTITRRGSTASNSSDSASIDSADSSASSGLRRKPIPVEMFLRA